VYPDTHSMQVLASEQSKQFLGQPSVHLPLLKYDPGLQLVHTVGAEADWQVKQVESHSVQLPDAKNVFGKQDKHCVLFARSQVWQFP
jgi:hypothetical protein